MQVLVVEFRVRAPFIAAFAEAIQANAQESENTEPGCRRFDVCRDPADPALFFLYELYDDEAALDAHLHSTHFVAMTSATSGWVETKTVRRFVR